MFQSLMGAQPIPYVQYTDALLPPEGEQRDETMILLQLAAALWINLVRVTNGEWVSQWLDGPWQAARCREPSRAHA